MREELHTLAGAYALDALPPRDRRLFEGHLARCGSCAVEVRGFRATAGRLGAAAAERPPPRLRASVLSRIDQVRQLPPADATAAVAGRVGDGTKGVRGSVETWRGRWRQWRLGFSAALAAGVVTASVAVAITMGTDAGRMERRLERAEAANRDISSVLSAGDARVVSRPLSGGGAGTATMIASRSRGRFVFAGEGFGQLPPSRTYELWAMGPDGTRPAGLLRPDPDGRTAPIVGGWTGNLDRIGLTTEPAGGSLRPTTKPLVVLNLT